MIVDIKICVVLSGQSTSSMDSFHLHSFIVISISIRRKGQSTVVLAAIGKQIVLSFLTWCLFQPMDFDIELLNGTYSCGLQWHFDSSDERKEWIGREERQKSDCIYSSNLSIFVRNQDLVYLKSINLGPSMSLSTFSLFYFYQLF